MRSSRVFTLVAGMALIAACGGDGGNGPSNTAPTAAFTYSVPTSAAPSPTRARTRRHDRLAQLGLRRRCHRDRHRRPQPHLRPAGTYNVTVERHGQRRCGHHQHGASPSPSRPPATGGPTAGFTSPAPGLDLHAHQHQHRDGQRTSTCGVGLRRWPDQHRAEPRAGHLRRDTPTTFTITLVVTSDGADQPGHPAGTPVAGRNADLQQRRLRPGPRSGRRPWS